MKRKIEGIFVASLLLGTVAGCHRRTSVATNQGSSSNSVGVGNPLGPTTGGPDGAANTASNSSAGVAPAGPSPVVRQPVPAMPKADEVAAGSYTTPNGTKIEIAGVCRVTEDSVGCWDMEGGRSKELEKMIESSLTHNNNGFGGGPATVSLAYKKKNRIIVTKTTTGRMQPGRMFDNVALESAGDSLNNVGGMGFGGFGPGSMPSSDPTFRYEVRAIATDPNRQATSAFFRVTVPSRQTVTLALRNHATCRIEDTGLKIIGIAKGRFTPPHSGPVGGPVFSSGPGMRERVWSIRVRNANPSSKYVVSLSASGMTIDAAGHVVSQDEYMKAIRRRDLAIMEYNRKPHKPGDMPPTSSLPTMLTSVQCFQVWSQGAESVYSINVDPKQLKQLNVSASQSKRIEIKGIPLDPR